MDSPRKSEKRQGLISKVPEIVVSKHLVMKGIFTSTVANHGVRKNLIKFEIVDPAPNRTVY